MASCPAMYYGEGACGCQLIFVCLLPAHKNKGMRALEEMIRNCGAVREEVASLCACRTLRSGIRRPSVSLFPQAHHTVDAHEHAFLSHLTFVSQ